MINNILSNTKSIKKTKSFLDNGKDWITSIKNKNNNAVNRRDINESATKFFEELFKSRKEIKDDNTSMADSYSKLNTVTLFTKTDIEQAIDDLKTDKCTGNDGIVTEMLKYGKQPISTVFTMIFNDILITQQIPKRRKQATITHIHIKGNKDDINNYRPISNISMIYKLFSKVMYTKIKDTLNRNQPREQAGFREGFSTTDHLQTMNQLIEKTNEFEKPIQETKLGQ
ncbi:uncharacterized protein LOC129951530 [Eupeodes corollae]|uniref:uncharacterized protein LOC129951530 n=1 Tax=Eupeodes corollae TaxID=290404 RepID=UPI002491332D|nr:uncharacterized protein LOC129951530 [Eupeodes corollae]